MSETVVVAVRSRPLNKKEIAQKEPAIVKISESVSIEIQSPIPPPKHFTFDHCFDADSLQSDVYDATARRIVDSAIEGFNGTIFAYGQTGTGKTFTMQGDEKNPGILPSAFKHIFDVINVQSESSKKFLVRASFLEIYNEEIRDLLSKQPPLQLKEHPENGVYVKSLTSYIIKNVGEMQKCMDVGNEMRMVGATLMNEQSSRSHSIFSITIESSHVEGGDEKYKVGKLHLVDLAGSERQSKTGAKGDRLKEATKINLSLSALGNCISALVDGKSSTLMIATLSPASYNFEETMSTLRYANRAKNIKNRPKINEDPKDALLRQYQEQVKQLKHALELKQQGKLVSSGQTRIVSSRSEERLADFEDEDDEEKGDTFNTIDDRLDSLEMEKEKLMSSNTIVAAEKQRLTQELEKRQLELGKEMEARKSLSAKIRSIESKLLIGGNDFKSHVEDQEKKIRETQLEMKLQAQKERLLNLAITENLNLQTQITEKYSSLQEEATLKTKKLQKLLTKLEEVKRERSDLTDEFRQEMENYLSSVRELSRELNFMIYVIENYIPIDDRLKCERKAVYDQDNESWFLEKDQHGQIKRVTSNPESHIPICRYAKNCIQSGKDNVRYRKENIISCKLDIPERTTYTVEEYQKVCALYTQLEDSSNVIVINASSSKRSSSKSRK